MRPLRTWLPVLVVAAATLYLNYVPLYSVQARVIVDPMPDPAEGWNALRFLNLWGSDALIALIAAGVLALIPPRRSSLWYYVALGTLIAVGRPIVAPWMLFNAETIWWTVRFGLMSVFGAVVGGIVAIAIGRYLKPSNQRLERP
jgi:hypothetical protein